MADYPDWVMAHKKKGTYINFVNGKYYLYAAHSERVPGTKKVLRISDGYIGRITQQDGLIPARNKVTGEVCVYEYGLCMTILDTYEMIAASLRREFRGATDFVLASSILWETSGKCDSDTYEGSYLSVKYPEVNIDKMPTDKQKTGIERCRRMISDMMSRRFSEDLPEARERLSKIYMVKVNGQFYRSRTPDGTTEWLKTHGIRLEG
ncbi:MAG: Transposase IS1634 family [Candidatus Uhrbacteria bacterium GW2011_GWD2_52_7]|uniref:Transposase IS1634 family n=1 Tax=Candidatus Uhrbacteria bacterium GW2011_GWD2_52_7 TaxID=1618989 RepID=A0A0G1XDD4_9BACT|nr:MAG: Transposase IS1634 family [Candidatus Uhrbacteria bacterium GW2011_GWD2_52_7]